MTTTRPRTKLLAPWLQKQVTPKKLRNDSHEELLADATPVDFVISGNDSTLDELRDHYRDTTERRDAHARVGERVRRVGPPSISFPTLSLRRTSEGWMSIDLTPELDDPSGLDYVLASLAHRGRGGRRHENRSPRTGGVTASRVRVTGERLDLRRARAKCAMLFNERRPITPGPVRLQNDGRDTSLLANILLSTALVILVVQCAG
jgi:hypothetical protein